MSVTSYSPDEWEWRGLYLGDEWLVQVQLDDGQVHVEAGPLDPAARRHEAGYGRQSYESYLESPAPWVCDFPDLAVFITKVVKSKVART